jgi:predicted DNA-binding transcriptional regulator YafY
MQWEVFRRCLRILAELQHQPLSRDELIKLAYGNKNSAKAAVSALEKDLIRLRYNLGVDIVYDDAKGRYVFRDVQALICFDLPPAALEALVFLANTFEPQTPNYQNIQTLIACMERVLPAKRRPRLHTYRGVHLNLRQIDQDQIEETTFEKLEQAYLERRLLEFEYLSPQQADLQSRIHTVETRKIYFDTSRKHYYLYGFCRGVRGPKGQYRLEAYCHYRIGRIQARTIQILPERFPVVPPAPKTYAVIYRLSANIARQGVSAHFEATQTTAEPDGSVLIRAQTHDIFFATRTLLYYGPNCQVIGGLEMLAEMQRLVGEMAKNYDLKI